MDLQQETKNKILFKRIVDRHFFFDEKSKKLFHHILFFERDISEEFNQFIQNSPDLRARFKLKDDDNKYSIFADQDYGWHIFKTLFYFFYTSKNIGYREFYENKSLDENGNKVRLSKLIKKFYTSDKLYSFRFIDNFFRSDIFRRYVSRDEEKRERVFRDLKKVFDIKTIGSLERLQVLPENYNFKLMYEVSRDGVYETIKHRETLDEDKIKELIHYIIQIANEIIGEHKAPRKDNLQMVLSLNPIDWFLCSTGENWSSCLNLETETEGYWTGLPFLIGDKSRALVYITDGSKKEYMGMKVDKMISRSWVLLFRHKKTKETFWNFVKEYPNTYGLKNIFEGFIGKETYTKNQIEEDLEIPPKKLVGKYYFTLMHMKIENYKIFTSIYLDSSKIKIAKKNKAKYDFGRYAYYRMDGGGVHDFAITPDGRVRGYGFSEDIPPLSEIVDKGTTIIDY